jgi:hypothetical protein
MTVVPFPAPTPAAPSITCDITVEKAGQTRRWILRQDGLGHWRGDVWFGRAHHRPRRRAVGIHDAKLLEAEFAREIRDYLAGGWTEVRQATTTITKM